MSDGFREHPLLTERGVAHGFGTRGARAPDGVVRPRQVHGDRAVLAPVRGFDEVPDADAILSVHPGPTVAVVTADCVPILVAAGHAVAAVHAGWRGLARGVIPAALELLADHAAGAPPRAVIGPHIGCCYEIDAPVVNGLGERFGDELDAALTPSRPGHHRLDLARLTRRDLERAGVDAQHVAEITPSCTFCDAEHFHSYRRDGDDAGRLLHFVTPGPPPESS